MKIMIKRIIGSGKGYELSWKEKYPLTYDTCPSDKDIEWLKNKIIKDKLTDKG